MALRFLATVLLGFGALTFASALALAVTATVATPTYVPGDEVCEPDATGYSESPDGRRAICFGEWRLANFEAATAERDMVMACAGVVALLGGLVFSSGYRLRRHVRRTAPAR